tara:strand:+ start:236 stop:508 length:273 start_codon:yes stop_codon:yes gene_type:complete
MENQSDDILDNLTFVNGKEEVDEVITPKKKVAKKAVKKAAKKAVPEAPKVSYSYEDLKNLSSTDLKNLCKKLKVPSHKRKPQMIENILNG